MKKLVFLFFAVLTTAFSSNLFAQSTGINPMRDSVHVYTVNSNAGSTYAWTLTADAAGATADLIGTVATATGAATNEVTLTWTNPVVGTIYYLHVEETSSVATGSCKNRKVLAIEAQNSFRIDIVNVAADGSLYADDDSLDFSVCAPDIPNTISWNGSGTVDNITEAQNFNYEYGTVYFYYKMTAAGIDFANKAWVPEFVISQVAGANATIAIDYIVGGAISGSPTWNASGWTIGDTEAPSIPAGAGNDYMWIRITVANGTGTPATANENTADNTYTFTITGNSADEDSNTIINTPDTPVQTQSARPDTGVIGTDN